ncbi:MAG: EamA/RhaT family transporter [Acidobacteria bacterium]|nr:MAG: EamA/RhaT family transporter [Acidobacteriota bacterium]
MTPRARSRLELLAAAVLFSTAGAAIKACALGAAPVAGFRAGVAALAVLALVPAARRGFSARAAVVGVAYAVTVVLFVLANRLTTAASTIFLQATSPLYIVLLQRWLLRERVERRDLAALAALAAGLALVLLDTPSTAPTAPDPRRGNLVAAVSAFTCAFMMIGLRWLSRATADGGAGAAAVVLGNVFAFASMLPWAVPAHGARPLDWALLGYLGVFQIGVAYKLLLSALRHVPALEASLLLFVEPVLSPVWAWLFHGERPGPWTLAGGALILMTTAWRGWSERSGPLPVTPPPE